MSRLVVTLDLSKPDDVEKLWHAYAQVRALKDVDPELRRDLERLLPKIDPMTAAEIREALDTAAPAVVLAEWSDQFFAAKFGAGPIPTVGAFRHLRAELVPVDPTAEMLARIKAEPLELGPIVAEMLSHTSDLKLVVTVALRLAEEAGVEGDVAEKITTDAIRKARRVADR